MRRSRSELNFPDRINASTSRAMPITSLAADTFIFGESTKRKVRYDQTRLNALRPSGQRIIAEETLALIGNNGLNSGRLQHSAVASAARRVSSFAFDDQLY